MEIKARVPGMIVKVNVNEGDTVDAKDVLMVIEAMKMEQNILSPIAGEVVEMKAEVGNRVRSGEVLAVIE